MKTTPMIYECYSKFCDWQGEIHDPRCVDEGDGAICPDCGGGDVGEIDLNTNNYPQSVIQNREIMEAL